MLRKSKHLRKKTRKFSKKSTLQTCNGKPKKENTQSPTLGKLRVGMLNERIPYDTGSGAMSLYPLPCTLRISTLGSP